MSMRRWKVWRLKRKRRQGYHGSCQGYCVIRIRYISVFGVIHKKGIQEIKMDVVFEAGASCQFYCPLHIPESRKVRHIMDASIRIGENAQMRYSEIHYHGPFGG